MNDNIIIMIKTEYDMKVHGRSHKTLFSSTIIYQQILINFVEY